MSSEVADTLEELAQFLSLSARTDLRLIALDYVLGCSGTSEGRALIGTKKDVVSAVMDLVGDSLPTAVRNAVSCLINLSGDEKCAMAIMESPGTKVFLEKLLENVIKPDCALADPIAMLLSNLSRQQNGATTFVKLMVGEQSKSTIDSVVQALCVKDFNPDARLDFLAPFLGNLTLSEAARSHILNRDRCIIQRLLPYMHGKYSDVRRRGVVTVVKNCCFDTEHHKWLLSEDVDLLPALLLPLAGPEELPEDDMDLLPPELQYLEPTKEREAAADIRKMLVEALNQLCATKFGRMKMREQNVYVIIREYHKWEPVKLNEPAIYSLIDVLIGDEPKEEHSNLQAVEIPADVQSMLDAAVTSEGLLSSEDAQLNGGTAY